MKQLRQPMFLMVVINLVVVFFALNGLALSAYTPYSGNKLTMIISISFVIVIGIFQCVLYLKNYIDYRLNEMAKN